MFCHYCVEMYRATKDHVCEANEYLKPVKEACKDCGRYGSHICGMTVCRQCKQLRKQGSKNNYESHRCIIMKDESKKYFRTDLEDQKGYDLFAYN